MRKKVFDMLVDEVCEKFDITREQLFTKDKTLAEERFMLYLLCKQNSLKPRDIVKYMTENGYVVEHAPIIYGIRQAKKKKADVVYFRDAYMEIKKSIKNRTK